MSLQLQIINIPEGELLAETCFQIPASGGVLGRSTDSLVELPDSSRFLSGQHARIFQEENDWLVEDLSTNGLLVNSSVIPLGAGKKQTLSDGDILTLGDYRILVNLFSPDTSFNALKEPEETVDPNQDFLVSDQSFSANKTTLDLTDPFLERSVLAEADANPVKKTYEPAIDKHAASQDITEIEYVVSEHQSAPISQRGEHLINVFSEVPESIPEKADESLVSPLTDFSVREDQHEHQQTVVNTAPVTEIVTVQAEPMNQPPAIDLIYQLRRENEKLKEVLRKRERQKNRLVQHCMNEALEQTLMDFAPAYLEKLFDDYNSKPGLFARRDNWQLYERHFQRVMKEQTPKLTFMARYHAAMHALQESHRQEGHKQESHKREKQQERPLQEETPEENMT